MRAPEASIDVHALRANYARAREVAGGGRVLAVVKADAYGHGLALVAQALPRADGFAVGSVGEGLALRDLGVAAPVLVLQGFHAAAEIPAFLDAGLECVVHHRWQIEALERERRPALKRIWLKIDSGMGRFGVPAAAAVECYARLARGGFSRGEIVLMTHLASADDRNDEFTVEQLRVFARAADALPQCPRSVANSAGLLGWPRSRGEWNRAGIMLYGASPFVDDSAAGVGLAPVMRLSTRLLAVNEHRAGDHVGYGHTWRCQAETRIGIAAIGYGDGYPRHAPSGTPVVVRGQRVALAGRVSMDCIALDLTRVPAAAPGDEVELWGERVSVDEVAGHAGTIGYELLCAAGRAVRRLPAPDARPVREVSL